MLARARNLLLALVALVALAGSARAQGISCVPNPNDNGVPFTNSCPITAKGLNTLAPQQTGPTFTANVKGAPFNATGNGSTDDTAAVQVAISSATAGGIVWFPRGTYCIKSGPLSVTVNAVTLAGESRNGGALPAAGSVLSSCGTDNAILSMTGTHDYLRDIQLVGSPVVSTTKDVLTLGSGCDECTTNNVRISGGRYAINATNAGEVYLLDTAADSTYGGAIVYLTGTGGYIWKSKFDQAYPFATPAAGSTSVPVPNWIGTHSYSAGALAIAHGYILQATVGGVSGLGAPAVPAYGSTTIDGGVTWALVGNSTYYGVQCDTGCGGNLYITLSDFSADETDGIGLTNTLAGTAPSGVYIRDDTFGNNIYSGIAALAGFGFHVTGNSFGSVIANGGSGVSFVATGDDNIVDGNIMEVGGPSAGATCVFLDANNILVENNECSATTGVSVSANVTDFNIIGNTWFSGFGADVTGVSIASGTSDYYNIIGNDSHGTTTPISDGGSGIHKVIFDAANAQFGNYLGINLRVAAPTVSIASGFGSTPSISGSGAAGRITVGSGGASTGVVTLGANYNAHFPNCVANDETSAIATRVAATASNSLTFATVSGSWSAGDNLTYVCVGN